MKAAAAKTGRSLDEVAQERAANNPAGRFGDPVEFGEACAFLCGAHAGFITGQNLLLDGGAFPGTPCSPPPAGGAARSPGFAPAIFTALALWPRHLLPPDPSRSEETLLGQECSSTVT